ncbi:hypothetical protein SAMN06265784_102282 [Paraburkholderia susongensis]|uniref:Uncharacterized protein n=1 Tax=Paraburkholderia susongensis TaxID=1515439 RepID=A0A1X7J7B0_9BURK|nr:hypothetical protein SAMN06265784_102282 [Paraburkholderia susongensis]
MSRMRWRCRCVSSRGIGKPRTPSRLSRAKGRSLAATEPAALVSLNVRSKSSAEAHKKGEGFAGHLTLDENTTEHQVSIPLEVEKACSLLTAQGLHFRRQVRCDENRGRLPLTADQFVSKLQQGQQCMARLTTGLHLANQRVAFAHDFGLRDDVDGGVRPLGPNVQMLDHRHLLKELAQGLNRLALHFR